MSGCDDDVRFGHRPRSMVRKETLKATGMEKEKGYKGMQLFRLIGMLEYNCSSQRGHQADDRLVSV